MIHFFKKPFDSLLRLLLILLPFHVILTVFFQFKVGIPGFGAYKELLLFILGATVVYEFFRVKKFPKFDLFDGLIGGYIGYLILVSLANHGSISSIVYGGRYDFEFLLAFLIVKHGKEFVSERLSYYIRLFVYSWGIALILGMLVRFLFGEQILLHFGFSPRLSMWEQGGSIPIYHGVEWASVRRFQGIFDGPNQTAFFLLTYMGVFLHYLYAKKDWRWLTYTCICIMFGLVFLTYTRSALLGVIAGGFSVIVLNIKVIITKHWRQALAFLGIIVVFCGLVFLKYGENVKAIVLRGGSTKGHYERMLNGWNEFRAQPLGHGLAQSGPAYRLVHDVTNITEDKYIPESWYVQQLVEGGIVGLLLFLAILGLMAWKLYQKSVFILGGFIGILTMNAMLHSFETSWAALSFFMIVALLIGKTSSSPHQEKTLES